MPRTIYYIYKITNTINGDSYIGFSKNPKSRWNDHNKPYTKSKVSTAIRQYGTNNFLYEIIYSCKDVDGDFTENVMEPYFISEYNTYEGPGYNCTSGGRNHYKSSTANGRKRLSEQHRMEISIRQKKRFSLPNHTSAVTRSKISAANKGRINSESHRKNISLSKMGHSVDDVTRNKISVTKTIHKIPDENELFDMLSVFSQKQTADYYGTSQMTVCRWVKLLKKRI